MVLGWHADVSPEQVAAAVGDLLQDGPRRDGFTARGKAFVDGEGVSRVLMHVRGDSFWLRPAMETDCRTIFEWSNEPESRGMSFSTRPIEWDEHAAWFRQRLMDANTLFLVALDAQDTPVGQVRFQLHSGQEADISVAVDVRRRAAGLGRALLRRSVSRLFGTRNVSMVRAYIKRENAASLSAFAKAGFVHQGTARVSGQTAECYVCQRGVS
jgi:RimJ/RimL family protein N-acetyltransferase